MKTLGETLERVAKTPHQRVALFFVDSPVLDMATFDPDSLPEHGTMVRVHHASQEGGKLQFVAQGLARVRIRGWLRRKPPYLVEVDYPKSDEDPRDEVKAYGMALINAIKELLPLNPLYSEELKNYLNRFSPNDPSPLTDFAAALTTAPGAELQEVLDTVPVLKRMEKCCRCCARKSRSASCRRNSPARSIARSASASGSSSSRTAEDHPARAGITKDDKAPTPTSSARAWKARWCHRPRRSASTRN